MRYIDSGTRDPTQALGTWLHDIVDEDVSEIRFQSGFFSSDSLHFLQPALSRLADNDQIARALVGSNDRSTIRRDVERLVSALRLPRNAGRLGVVKYDQGYYHPKTLHIRRADGSQAGYVGSANLTGSGVAALHVEAGITLDTNDGDPSGLLEEIASAVDSWFDTNPAGLYRVTSPDDIEGLVRDEIIAERQIVQRPVREAGRRGGRRRANRLQPLIHIPRTRVLVEPAEVLVEAADVRRIILPVATRHGFPPYLLFAPENAPTHGVTALSGSSLPAGVSGLIIRLNRDSGRHFEGRGGTANISVPVPSLNTLRFGRSPQYQKPRAEFGLRLRYIGAGAPIVIGREDTNIMGYGFTGGTGHRDVRMVVPAATRVLAQQITASGKPLPQVGDPALLEWPSADSNYEFRLSFLQRRSQLFLDAGALLATAAQDGTTVGASACWLPENLSPEW